MQANIMSFIYMIVNPVSFKTILNLGESQKGE